MPIQGPNPTALPAALSAGQGETVSSCYFISFPFLGKLDDPS